MLKSWHDEVVQCGENPRHLLAAAFVSLQNFLLASELIPEDQFEGNLCLNVQVYRWVNGWINEWMSKRINEWLTKLVKEWMNALMQGPSE